MIRQSFLLAACVLMLLASSYFPMASAQTVDGPVLPRVFVDTTYRTPTGATINVPSGGDVQAALDAAKPGDTVVLAAGATYVVPWGGLVLPSKDNPNNLWIVIRTSNLTGVPAAGTRVQPSQHAAAMPKLITPNGNPVLRTASAVHHYRFIGVEFGIAKGTMSVNSLVSIGKSGTSQDSLSEVPHHIIFDRCYVHGNSVGNARRGFELNSAHSAVIDSHVSDFHHSDGAFDSQAIVAWNSPGPLKIVNNYLEAASENVMFGGSDPSIANLIPSDIEIRRNLFTKRVSWKDYILKKPSGPSVSGTSASGTLRAGSTYYYQVTARGPIGSKTGTSSASSEAQVTLGSGQNAVKLSWGSVTNATEYYVYRTSNAPGTTRSWVYYVSKSTSFTDTNAAGTTGSSPATTASKWTVKNLLEVKNAQRILIDGNIFENCWKSGQLGDAFVFKSSNQGGSAPWSVAQDIQVTNNRIRHVGAGLRLQGKDDDAASGLTQRVRLSNNLFEDVGGVWGTGNLITITGGPADVIIEHNTAFHTNLALTIDGKQTLGFQFTNNLMPHNKYGVKGSGTGTGTDTLVNYFPGYIFLSNVLAGGKASYYPSFNFFPASLSGVGFVNFADGDYRLSSTSLYKNAGSAGRDIGCNIDALNTAQTRP